MRGNPVLAMMITGHTKKIKRKVKWTRDDRVMCFFNRSVLLETGGGSCIFEVAKCDVQSNAPEATIALLKMFVSCVLQQFPVCVQRGKAPSAMAPQQSRP